MITNPACALKVYIELMRKWVNAVREGQPTEELIPVNVAPTEEWAKELEGRLRFLEGAILSRYEADLKACAE
jgi:transposase-like protein